MADHRPLRRPGGAGGVDEDREVLGLRQLQALGPGLRVELVLFASESEQVVVAHGPRILEVPQALHVEDDDLLERGALLAHLEHLVELLLILDEHHLAARVVDQVVHLLGRVRRVDPRAHAADAEHPHVGEHPLDDRVGEDAGDVALAEAERPQPQPRVARLLAEGAPGDVLPDAEVLLAHRDAVAVPLDAAPEHRRHGAGEAGVAPDLELAAVVGRARLTHEVGVRFGAAHAHLQVLRFFHRRTPLGIWSFMPR